MIKIEHISKKFKRLVALDDVTASFDRGQVISLIGPNGSGKTTLIKSILGMVRPDAGRIYCNGLSIDRDYNYRKDIGYMPQIGRYPDNMKVGQLLNMLKHIRGNNNDHLDTDLIRKFGLSAIYDKPMRTLSGGTRQKVSACLAFLFNPGILILDEPTAGLDPLSSETLKEKIILEKSKGKLILITSHILSDLDDITTHVMYLQEGRVHFFKKLQTLQEETCETRLGKAIARIMKREKANTLKIKDIIKTNQEEIIK